MTKKNTNPICAILWRDAAFTDDSAHLNVPPTPRLTCGFIIETNDEFTNIACSVSYNKETGEIIPADGFIIPDKAIIDFRKIDFYDKQ